MTTETTDNTPDETPTPADTGERAPPERTTLARTSDGRTERKRLTRLALGELPADMRGAGRTATRLRLALEAAVIDRHGSITLSQACLISTAARWERHGAVSGWLLRQHAESMTHDQRLTYSREIARASAERDKAIERLRLERDPLASLYGPIFDIPHATDAPRSPATSAGDVAADSASTHLES
jgi:hypothetical protein